MKTKSKRVALKEVLKRELKDPEFSFYFQREKAISEIARLVRDARLKAGPTSPEGAKQSGRYREVRIRSRPANTVARSS